MSTRKATENYSSPMRLAMIVGLVAAVAGVAGLFISGADLFFQAYLIAFMFWLGISLGSMALLFLHFLLGTRWGLTLRRVAEAAAGSIWVMALLFIPLALGMTNLYPWTHPEAVAENSMLQAKTFYLNVPFFLIRAVIYFAVWIALALIINRLSARLSAAPGDAALAGRLKGLAAAGFILYFLTMTFASIDWLMSLEPLWTSTAFGLVTIAGQVLSAISFGLLALNLLPQLSLGRRWERTSTPLPYRDIGTLLLVFVMGWAYLAYFQLLIIWGANIPREVVWYIARTNGGWSLVAIFIAVFQFALPFIVLISARARHNLRFLALLGGLLLVTNLVNVFWHVKPSFFPNGFALSWLDIVLPVAMGGIWLAVFLFTLQRRPALNVEEQTALELTAEARQAH